MYDIENILIERKIYVNLSSAELKMLDNMITGLVDSGKNPAVLLSNTNGNNAPLEKIFEDMNTVPERTLYISNSGKDIRRASKAGLKYGLLFLNVYRLEKDLDILVGNKCEKIESVEII